MSLLVRPVARVIQGMANEWTEQPLCFPLPHHTSLVPGVAFSCVRIERLLSP